VTKLDGLVMGLGRTIKTIGAETPAFRSLATGINSASRAMERASVNAAAFQRNMTAAIAAAASAGGMPRLPGGGGAGGGGGGGGGGRAFGGYAHGGNIHLGPGGLGVGTVGIAAGGAWLPLAVGAAGVYGMHASYESAKDLDTERQRFRLLGLSGAQNADAFQFVDGMRAYGTTRAENMRAFREAQGVFRESGLSDGHALEGAKLAAPVLAKLDFLAKALGGESAAKMQTANMAMLRYVELSGGLKDASTFNRLADFGYRLNASSGGTVDWQQLLGFKKTAGTAGYALTEDALARLEPIMAEMSGGRAGTALATSYNRVTGITRVPNQIAHLLTDMGIWNKGQVDFNSQGGIKRINGNPLGVANTKLLAENPELFYETVIRPIYTKMKLSSDEIARDNAAIFGRTGGAFFNAIERALPTIQHSVEALKKTADITTAVDIARKGLNGQEQEFTAAWTDFKAAAGTTMLPFFSGLLKGGADILRRAGAYGESQKGEGFWSKVGGVLSGRASMSLFGESPYVANGLLTGGNKGGVVVMDGVKVGQIVTGHQVRAMGRPQTGGTGFDGRMQMAPAGWSILGE